MANPRLTPEQLDLARALLDEVRAKLVDLGGGDRELLFAYRRKVVKELGYDERSKPSARGRLKQLKMKEQGGICPLCNQPCLRLEPFSTEPGPSTAIRSRIPA